VQRFRRAAFYSQLKSKVGSIRAKATVLRINLDIDGAPIASHKHTHPRTLSNISPPLLSLGIAFRSST
jgi:hypothetical protein